MLEVRDARKAFGATRALDGAGFSVAAGEWLGLLGPNGAGKTTLVRAISGRVRLDGGSVLLAGTPLDSSRDAARAVLGVIPQELALYPNLTARENLEVFGTLSGVPRAELSRRVDWALEWTGLGDRAGDLSRTFSGGMNRRLNIAVGVLHRPRVVLLDEPTVGVDPQSRQRIWEMLGQLRDEGAALVLTTHQLDEAQEVCERIVIIDHGRTIAAGSFSELLRDTIGAGHHVTITLEDEAPAALAQRGFALDGAHVSRAAERLARDLPAMLAEIEATGARVADVHVRAPGLQAVFIHLTGRELRE